MSIGKYARELIVANPSMKNEEIVAKVKEKFQDAKTSLACIAWYRSDLKKQKKEAVRTIATVANEIQELMALHAKLKEELQELLLAEEVRKEEEAAKKLEEEQALEAAKQLLAEEIEE